MISADSYGDKSAFFESEIEICLAHEILQLNLPFTLLKHSRRQPVAFVGHQQLGCMIAVG